VTRRALPGGCRGSRLLRDSSSTWLRPRLRRDSARPSALASASPASRRRLPNSLLVGLVLLAAAARGPEVPAEPDDPRALLAADRPADAALALRRRAAADPLERGVWSSLGDVERLRCDLEAARAAYRRALAQDPLDPRARAGIAETYLLDARPADALGHALQGLATGDGAREGGLWRAKALALLDLGDLERARDAAARGAALAPADARVQEALARVRYRSGDMAGARDAYRRAAALDGRAEESNLRLGNGFDDRSDGSPWRDGAERAAFEAAVRALDGGALDEAGRRFENLCRIRPDAFKYRLGLGLARVAIRRRAEARFGGDAAAVYALLPAPAFDRVGEVVKGFGALAPADRPPVLVAVLPARRYWDRLVAAGATHEVFGVAEDLTDAPSRAGLRDRRTFDGRHYQHLRGVGGLAAATGVEKLREAAAFGFHTFAHEFAHQVHDAGFSEEQRAEVERLYARALAEGRCLDWYAASNVYEYFAQGYEAFVSLAKRGCLKDTERHTRDELEARDPALAAFLREHLDLSHETPEALAAFRAACAAR
jgi:cytochrome c-type biogenesis protein CcmH/NrfG